MKKRILSLALTALIAASVPATVFAATPAAICPVEGCHATEVHQHDGCSYAGHTIGDGHNHPVCNLENCTQNGIHDHARAAGDRHCRRGNGRHHS